MEIQLLSREYGSDEWIEQCTFNSWEEAANEFVRYVNQDYIDTENCAWKFETM